MANVFKCDVCGKDTILNPQTEMVYEEKEVEIEIPQITDSGTILVKQKIIQKYPKQAIMKRQNHQTGDVEDIQIAEMKDLQDRTYIVRLSIGYELIQKDFCKTCLTELILPELNKTWNLLSKISSR